MNLTRWRHAAARARYAGPLLGLALLAGAPGAGAADGERWEYVATGGGIKAYLDPMSVTRDGDYVRVEIRVEHPADRESSDKKFTYREVQNGQVMVCGARKGANVTTRFLDSAGTQVSSREIPREGWDKALRDIRVGTLQERILTRACGLAGVSVPPAEVAKPEPGKPAAKPAVSVGSGIIVATDGAVLTNQHVVEGCASITVTDAEKKRLPARFVAADGRNDLALLRASGTFPQAASLRQGTPVRAGESVTVVGFPLVNILGAEANVSFGYVSSTVGVRGDAASFQISAPVHKGNSGGPILDEGGQVIGIVTSKLNALGVAQSSGDLPQNISFGIKGEIAQSFLNAQGVRFQTGEIGQALDKVEGAAQGKAITVMVVCRRK